MQPNKSHWYAKPFRKLLKKKTASQENKECSGFYVDSSENSRPASSPRGGSRSRPESERIDVHQGPELDEQPPEEPINLRTSEYAFPSPDEHQREYILAPPPEPRPRNSQCPDRDSITPPATCPSHYEPNTPPSSATGSINGYSTDESMTEDEQAVEAQQQLPPPPHVSLPMAPQFNPSNQPPLNADSYYCPAPYDPNSLPPSHCSQDHLNQQRGGPNDVPRSPPPGQASNVDQQQPSPPVGGMRTPVRAERSEYFLDQRHPSDCYTSPSHYYTPNESMPFPSYFNASPSTYCMREPVRAQQSEYVTDNRQTYVEGFWWGPRGLEYTPRTQATVDGWLRFFGIKNPEALRRPDLAWPRPPRYD